MTTDPEDERSVKRWTVLAWLAASPLLLAMGAGQGPLAVAGIVAVLVMVIVTTIIG